MVRAFWPLPLGCQRSAGSVLNSVPLTPWKSRNSASTSPTGPPPTIATWVVGSAIDSLLTCLPVGTVAHRAVACALGKIWPPSARASACGSISFANGPVPERLFLEYRDHALRRRGAGRGTRRSPARRRRLACAAVMGKKISARRHAHEPLEHGGEGGRAVVAEIESDGRHRLVGGQAGSRRTGRPAAAKPRR